MLGKHIPYEQEKIIIHLESLIEDERINSIDVKEKLKRCIGEKKDDLKVHGDLKE